MEMVNIKINGVGYEVPQIPRSSRLPAPLASTSPPFAI